MSVVASSRLGVTEERLVLHDRGFSERSVCNHFVSHKRHDLDKAQSGLRKRTKRRRIEHILELDARLERQHYKSLRNEVDSSCRIDNRTTDPLRYETAVGDRILGLDYQIAVDAGVLEDAVNSPSGLVTVQQRYERFARKIGGLDKRLAGQSVARREDASTDRAQEGARRYAGDFMGSRCKADIELLICNQLTHSRRGVRIQPDRYARMVFVKIANDPWQEAKRKRWQRRNMQVAGREIANVASRLFQRVDANEASLNFMEKETSFGGNSQRAPFRANEQFEPKSIFEIGNELAHRRLGKVHGLRGLGDRSSEHHCSKRFQLTQVHSTLSAAISKLYSLSPILGSKE